MRCLTLHFLQENYDNIYLEAAEFLGNSIESAFISTIRSGGIPFEETNAKTGVSRKV